jgi:type IV pilus assembly protein PilA
MLNRLAKLREERAQGDKGFTLIELLVVVVIIGILIAIAIPLYLNYKKGAADKSAQSDLRNAISVIEQCNSDNSAYPTALASTGGTPTGCTAGKVTMSANSSLLYTTAAGPPVTYTLATTNSAGSPKYYCYNSANGGQVKEVTAATSLATATC